MTTDRSSQRQPARLGVIVVVIGAFISALSFDTASATATTVEPQVEIGESRSIERSTPAVTVNSAEPGHADEGAGVAVAGVAIARAAPGPNRFEGDLASGGTQALLLLAAALCAASATAAAMRYFSRRIVP